MRGRNNWRGKSLLHFCPRLPLPAGASFGLAALVLTARLADPVLAALVEGSSAGPIIAGRRIQQKQQIPARQRLIGQARNERGWREETGLIPAY